MDLLDGSSLTLVTPDTDTFTESEVSQIRRTDSVWNGMQYGFWTGLGAFVAGATIVKASGSDALQGPGGALFFGLAGGVGAVSGLLIDRAIGNDPIYQGASRRSVAVAPWVAKGGGGLSLSVEF